MLLCYIEERFYFLNLRGKITTFLRDMQVFEHESAELVDFDGEMSKNHRDALPNNEHTEGKREGTRGISREH